ncbi:DUF6527 family protein [Aneurinibacillus tyrosinisolvens]
MGEKHNSTYKIIGERNNITLNPSVDIESGCRSYFYIKMKSAIWCD